MDLGLSGKRALVTGSSRGIGKAICDALKKEGVIVTGWSRSEGVDLMKPIPYIEESFDFVIHNFGGGGTWLDPIEIMKKNYFSMLNVMEQTFVEVERVIVISSIYGKEKGPNPLFTAAKAAQIAYIKSMAKVKNRVCTFNTICPGHIDVGKPFPDNPDVVGKPEDVANIVTFLCSDKAKHINGACITVDGGESHSF